MKTLASLALAATAVAGAAQAQEARVPDRYGPAPSRTLTWQSQTPAVRTAAERIAPVQAERGSEQPAARAPMRLAAAPVPSGRLLGWAGKTQSAVERLPEREPAAPPVQPPRAAYVPPPAPAYEPYDPPARAYPAYEPPRREPALRPSAEADLPTSLYDAPRREPVLRPRQSVEPTRRASAPPPRPDPSPRHVEAYPTVADPYRPKPQARQVAAATAPAAEPPPVVRRAPPPQPAPAPVTASPSVAPAPQAPSPAVAHAPAAPARSVRPGGVPVPPSDPPRIASKYRITPDAPVRAADPAKAPARQAAGPADFDLAPVPAAKPVKTAAVAKRAAEAAPAPAAAPTVGKQAPRLYSLHREYGMTPDAIPAPPKGDNYVLIAPPEEPKAKDDESEVKAGGVG